MDEVEEYNPSYGSNRVRKNLVTGEIERMNLVQQHPAFKEDPFATLQEHLKNTLAEQKEKRQKEASEKAEHDKKKKEEKKQEKKERLQGVKKSSKKYKTRRSK
jgi:tRNA(Ile)-lysidine synthase TilS/MesJ